MTNNDYKFLTYKEAAKALSTSVETVRVQARRYHWTKRKNNQNKITIGIPIERLVPAKSDSETISEQFIKAPVHELQKQVAILSIELQGAKEKIEFLERQTDDLKTDRDAWRKQAQAKRFWFWQRAS